MVLFCKPNSFILLFFLLNLHIFEAVWYFATGTVSQFACVAYPCLQITNKKRYQEPYLSHSQVPVSSWRILTDPQLRWHSSPNLCMT